MTVSNDTIPWAWESPTPTPNRTSQANDEGWDEGKLSSTLGLHGEKKQRGNKVCENRWDLGHDTHTNIHYSVLFLFLGDTFRLLHLCRPLALDSTCRVLTISLRLRLGLDLSFISPEILDVFAKYLLIGSKIPDDGRRRPCNESVGVFLMRTVLYSPDAILRRQVDIVYHYPSFTLPLAPLAP